MALQSNLDSYFNKLVSFDTETTGLNIKTDNIWQVGFSSSKKGLGFEENTNPFFVSKDGVKVSDSSIDIKEFRERLRTSAGQFSEKAYDSGNFKQLISKYKRKKLLNLDKAVDKTIGKHLDTGDILVMQNHNFENKLLKQAKESGQIVDRTYLKIADKMENLDLSTRTTGLFQTPKEVSEGMRMSRTLFNQTLQGERLPNKASVKSYADSLNTVMDSYAKAIKDPSRTGTVVVEQMDVTRAMLANAASQGYIDSRHINIGMSIDFLKRSFDLGEEAHTALADSRDTVDIFKRTWKITEELRSGNVSDSTKEYLGRLNTMQYSEVDSQFLKTIDSVVNDFNTRGYTNNSNNSLYLAESTIFNKTTKTFTKLPGIQSNQTKITSLELALDNIKKRYAHYENSSWRTEHIEKLKNTSQVAGTKGVIDLNTIVEKAKPVVPVDALVHVSTPWWKEADTLFGKDMTKGKKYGILAGIASLGYIALKGSPNTPPDNDYYASEQFYDDEYLGTAFINFNDRNKHYMY